MKLLFYFWLSYAGADQSWLGRELHALRIQGESGVVECSFVRGEDVRIEDSSPERLSFFKASITAFSLSRAQVKEGDFLQAELRGSQWTNSRIARAVFRSADLREATFADIQLDSSDWTGADLRGAVFNDVVLGPAGFKGALYNDASVLPFDHATAAEMGMIYDP